MAKAEFLVQLLFEKLALIVGRATWRAAVDEVLRPAIRRQDADHPALDHTIEVAGPWLSDGGECQTETALLGGRLPRKNSWEAATDGQCGREPAHLDVYH